MDAALAESAELQLIPGVALSKEQIAALRRDIVWMVAEDVKLPDGSITKALAPKVYFSQTVQMKLSPGGALIAANEINIKAGGVLDNSGQIISDAATNLIVGDLINRGSISSGGILYVQAEQDISNFSGNLAGNDVTLEAGRDLRNVRSANNTATSTELGLEAGISASNNLNLSAGRNLTVVAANISAGGNASLNAGENLTVSTLATQQNSSGAYNAYINKVTHLGSQLDIGQCGRRYDADHRRRP
jgi:filamentous hemagglutinin